MKSRWHDYRNILLYLYIVVNCKIDAFNTPFDLMGDDLDLSEFF